MNVFARGLFAAALTAASLSASGTGSLAQPARSGGGCFNLNQMMNSRLVTPRRLVLRLSGGVYYELDFASDCDVTDTTLGLRPVDNSGIICSAIGVNVFARGGGGMCLPTRLHRLTPDEVAAYPRGALP